MKLLKRCILFAFAVTLFGTAGAQNTRTLPAYLDESQDIEMRVEDALPRLTLDENMRIMDGQSKNSSAGAPRL